MACNKGRVTPSSVTKLRLFADSAGYCQNPDCLSALFRDIDDDTIHIAEMAHVISAGDSGPRADDTLSDDDRAKYDNLILLCPTCHTIIDKAEDKFPEDVITRWKQEHVNRIADAFGLTKLDSREAVREMIEPILRENHLIFDKYGPMTEERFNPESTMPAQWKRKIKSNIIPNNRRILSICNINSHLLEENELETLELFRQHIQDFEAKHLENVMENGMQFPNKMDQLFE